MNSEYELDITYASGARAAFEMVLNFINTLEDKHIHKKEIYHAVYDMKPPKRFTAKDLEEIFL